MHSDHLQIVDLRLALRDVMAQLKRALGNVLQLPLCFSHRGASVSLLSLLLFKQCLQFLDGGLVASCYFLQLSASSGSIGVQR
jgi:hypothetical protein